MVWVHAIWPRAKLSQWQRCQLNGVDDLVHMSSWELSPGTAKFISTVTPWVFSLRWIELLWLYRLVSNDHDEMQFTWRPPDGGCLNLGWCDSGAELHSNSLTSWTQPKSRYKTHHPHLLSWKSLFFNLNSFMFHYSLSFLLHIICRLTWGGHQGHQKNSKHNIDDPHDWMSTGITAGLGCSLAERSWISC